MQDLKQTATNYARLSAFDDCKQDPLYNNLITICKNDADFYEDYKKLNVPGKYFNYIFLSFIPLIATFFVEWKEKIVFVIAMFLISIIIANTNRKKVYDIPESSQKTLSSVGLFYTIGLIPLFLFNLFFNVVLDLIDLDINLLVTLYLILFTVIFVAVIFSYRTKLSALSKKGDSYQKAYDEIRSVLTQRDQGMKAELEKSLGNSLDKRYYWWDNNVLQGTSDSEVIAAVESRTKNYGDTGVNKTTYQGLKVSEIPSEEKAKIFLELLNDIKNNGFVSFDGLPALHGYTSAEDILKENIYVIYREQINQTVESTVHTTEIRPDQKDIDEFARKSGYERDLTEMIVNNGMTYEESYNTSILLNKSAEEINYNAYKSITSDIERKKDVDNFIRDNTTYENTYTQNVEKNSNEFSYVYIIGKRIFIRPAVTSQDDFLKIVDYTLDYCPTIKEELIKTPFKGFANNTSAKFAAAIVHENDFWGEPLKKEAEPEYDADDIKILNARPVINPQTDLAPYKSQKTFKEFTEKEIESMLDYNNIFKNAD